MPQKKTFARDMPGPLTAPGNTSDAYTLAEVEGGVRGVVVVGGSCGGEERQ